MPSSEIDIESMTTDERLALIQRLWDSLSDEDVPLTPAQATELDRRLDEMERDGGTGIPWEEVEARIRSRLA